MKMVWPTSIMSWHNSDETGSSITTSGLNATKSRVFDLLGSGESSTIGFGDNTRVNALSYVSISTLLSFLTTYSRIASPQFDIDVWNRFAGRYVNHVDV